MPKIDDTSGKNQPKRSSDTRPRQTLPVDDYADLEERFGSPPALEQSAVVLPIRQDVAEDSGWQEGLKWRRGARGERVGITRDPGNATLILANDAAWAGLRFDVFSGREICDEPPRLEGMPEPETPEALELYAAHWLAMRWDQTFTLETVRGAIHVASRQRSYHAVWDWLEPLAWDGMRRVDTWLSSYLGAEDTPTHRAIGRMWLISAVARAHRPGAKVDHMLILEGDQGDQKTTALEGLCGADWFQPDLRELGSKDAMVTLRGKWVVCMDELHALRSVDVIELAKNYLTRTVDKYRPPYGRHEIEQPRSCIFAGTTNAETYLSDPTGNRRFWPVKVAPGGVDLEAIRRDRDQLWAEAKELYQGGVKWWPDREMQRELNEHTEHRAHGDTWEDLVSKAIRGLDWTTVGLVLTEIGVRQQDQKHSEQIRVAKLLVKLGWERYRQRDGLRLTWRYRPSSRSLVPGRVPESVPGAEGDDEAS